MRDSRPDKPFGGFRKGASFFVWRVKVGGYEWRNDVRPESIRHAYHPLDDEGPWIVRKDPLADQKSIGPMKEFPALHRLFLQVPPFEESIASWVGAFGTLGIGPRMCDSQGELLADSCEEYGSLHTRGVSLGRWRYEMARLAMVLGLYDLAKAGNTGKLGQVLQWQGKDTVSLRARESWRDGGWQLGRIPLRADEPAVNGYYSVPSVAEWPSIDFTAKSWLEGTTWRFGDVKAPAYEFCYQIINHVIDGGIDGGIVTPMLLSNWDTREADLVLQPKTLFAALWTSALIEVFGAVKIAYCEGCHQYFRQTDPRQTRCSAKCRKRVKRKSDRAKSSDRAGVESTRVGDQTEEEQEND